MVKRVLKGSYLALILLFMYLPILILVVFSFNEGKSMANWSGFTLQWYADLFSDRLILNSLWVTLSVAVISALAATVIGTFAAIGIHNMGKTPRAIITNISYLPVANPDLVTGISMMLLFVFLGMPRGYVTLVLAHITFNLPYVIFSVLPKLKQTRNQTYEAALDLGATPSEALRKVVIPEIMPGIISGFILAFTLSLDDFVVSFFTQQNVQNLSITIYSLARKGINPKINALSTIMFVTVLILLIIVNRRASKEEARMKNKNGKRNGVRAFSVEKAAQKD